jgi:hypothetical protein
MGTGGHGANRGGGGASGKSKAEADTKARARDWLAGKQVNLWPREEGRKGKDEQREIAEEVGADQRARAEELVKEGLLSKACAALISEPPVPITEAVVEEMRTKHPSPRPQDTERCKELREVGAAAAGQMSMDDIEKAIKSFPRGSAGGPSGLRPQHLKDAMVAGWGDEVARQLRNVANKMARGEIPEAARPYVLGAALTALAKPEGKGLRPVAAGETIRRVVAKGLWGLIKEETKEKLEPAQVGVGTSMGAEMLVHTVSGWLRRNGDKRDAVLAMLDLSNAFNEVDRWAVRSGSRNMAHSLVPWVDACYGKPTALILGGNRLDSRRGVQQGDPLGPALFGMAIQEGVRRATQTTRDKFGQDSINLMIFSWMMVSWQAQPRQWRSG